MLEDYYVKPSTVDRVRASWLAPQIESYLEWLEVHGYSRLVVYRRLPLLFHFADWMEPQIGFRGRAGAVIPVGDRKIYVEALEKASVGEDIVPFADFLAGLVKKGLAGGPLPAVPNGS